MVSVRTQLMLYRRVEWRKTDPLYYLDPLSQVKNSPSSMLSNVIGTTKYEYFVRSPFGIDRVRITFDMPPIRLSITALSTLAETEEVR